MKLKFILTIIPLLIGNVLIADPVKQIPFLLNYQGMLTDEGGNLLSNGPADVTFRILDPAGTVIYEEGQTIDVANGSISAIIGNGINPGSGAPTGGLTPEILDPTVTHFLQVEIAGQRPYDNMEIVSVPYSFWADTALRLPEGAITGDMIGRGVITREHLNNELISAIFPEGIPRTMLPADTVYAGDFEGFRNTIQSTTGASRVGVNSTFIYSGSQTVQGVLKDLDLAVKRRQEEVDFARRDYGTRVTDEASERILRDNTLRTDITSEATTRASADTAHANTNIATAHPNGAFPISRLDTDIATQAELSTEASNRSTTDTTLQNNINAEGTARSNADASLRTDLASEAATRSSSDGSLQSQITSHVGRTDNPHGVTIGQIGAAAAADLSSHTGATSAHGSDGVVVGLTTLEARLATLSTSFSTSLPPTGGLAKVWANFTYRPDRPIGPITIHDSYNVASVVKSTETSLPVINFSSPLANTNYAVLITANNASLNYQTKTVDSVTINGPFVWAGTEISVVIFGD